MRKSWIYPPRLYFSSIAFMIERFYLNCKTTQQQRKIINPYNNQRNKINAEIFPLNTCQNTTHTRLRWWGRLSSWCHFERSKLTTNESESLKHAICKAAFVVIASSYVVTLWKRNGQGVGGRKQHLTGVACTMCHWTSFA